MQDRTIENMSPATKEWFAKAVVGMILADGRIEQAELDYLKSLLSFLGDGQIVQNISDMLKGGEIPELGPVELDTNESLEIVKHLTVMAVVDENLARHEVDFLYHVSTQLGLTKSIADRFLSLAKEKLRRAKYFARLASQDFTEQVRCFDLTEYNCMFYTFRSIAPNTNINLQFCKNPEENKDDLYLPIAAESSWCRSVQSKFGNYVVMALFEAPLQQGQGLELIKFTE